MCGIAGFVLPQPGLIQDLASKGVLTPLGDDVAAWVKENYAAGDSWAKLGTYTGKDGKNQVFAVHTFLRSNCCRNNGAITFRRP